MARPTVVIPPAPSSVPPELHGECKRQESQVLAHPVTNTIRWPNTSLVGWLWAPEMLYFFSSAFSFLRQMFTISVHQEAQWLDSVFLGLPGPDVLILFIQTGSCPDWPRRESWHPEP